ncbi:unnamed protein product [Cunninghamella blakesleeana]
MIQTILNYFKYEEEEKKDNSLVLIDIEATIDPKGHIECVKKEMDDPDLKYIAISYRWGETEEDLLKVTDYIAHTSSFALYELKTFIHYIYHAPDLKGIPYLWIDAISIDQKNHVKKKEAMFKMNQIYERASFILAVPDLHLRCLRDTDLWESIIAMKDYHDIIYHQIINHDHEKIHTISNHNEKNNVITEDGLKKQYQLLAHLLEAWSNRTWVINECEIAKKKYKQHGIPLKYTFLCLMFRTLFEAKRNVFSFHFDENEDEDEKKHHLLYQDVDDHKKWSQFINKKINHQRSHLDMILNSEATINEDRFHTILPSWEKYHPLIKNKNTISEWQITDMTSVRLKLYDIMDLWDKATLLYACSPPPPSQQKEPISFKMWKYPTFASLHHKNSLQLIEKNENKTMAYETYEHLLLKHVNHKSKEEINGIKQLIHKYKMEAIPLWKDNLIHIQLNPHPFYPSLSVKSMTYFILVITDTMMKDDLSKQALLDYIHPTHYVFIPFFTLAILDNTHLRTDSIPSGIYLIGNLVNNKWVLYNYYYNEQFTSNHICYNDYTFNIY